MFYPFLMASDKGHFLKQDTEVNEYCNSIGDIVPLSQSREKSDKTPSLYFLFNKLPLVSQYGVNILQSNLVKLELWLILAPNIFCLQVKQEITAKAGPLCHCLQDVAVSWKKTCPIWYLMHICWYVFLNIMRQIASGFRLGPGG